MYPNQNVRNFPDAIALQYLMPSMSDEEEKDKDYIAGDGESPREEAGNDVMRRVPVPERGDVKYQLSGMYRNWFLEYASYVISNVPCRTSPTGSNPCSGASCMP